MASNTPNTSSPLSRSWSRYHWTVPSVVCSSVSRSFVSTFVPYAERFGNSGSIDAAPIRELNLRKMNRRIPPTTDMRDSVSV
jgi:hypothetical protein